MKYKVGDELYSDSTQGVYIVMSIGENVVIVTDNIYLSHGLEGCNILHLFKQYVDTRFQPAGPYLAKYQFYKDLEKLLNE